MIINMAEVGVEKQHEDKRSDRTPKQKIKYPIFMYYCINYPFKRNVDVPMESWE